MKNIFLLALVAGTAYAQSVVGVPSVSTGGGGGGASSSPFLQTISGVSSQVINHNLGTSDPWVTCWDGSGNVLGGATATTFITDIKANTTNQATVTFSGVTTGTCLVSTGGMGPSGNGFLYRGAWSNATNYSTNDVITYSGSSYVALQAGSNNQPNLSPTFWGVLAAQGSQGFSAQSTTTQADTTSARAFSSSDCGLMTLRSNAASLLTDTVPQAGTAGITNGCVFWIKNTNAYGLGPISWTPSTSTVNGQAAIWVFPNQIAMITNDSSNYYASYMGRPVLADTWQFNTANMISTAAGTFSGVTATAISGSATDTNYGVSCSFPPNLPAGAKFLITADTVVTTAGGAVNYILKLRTNTPTDIWSTTAQALPATTVTANGHLFNWIITVTGSPNASTIIDANNAGPFTNTAVQNSVFAPTVDTTSSWLLRPSIQYNGTPSGYMVAIREWHCEWLNQQ